MKKLLYFTAHWCGPCKQLSPVMARLGLSGEMNIEKVDIDAQSEMAAQYNVKSIPTVVKLDGSGNEIGRFVGYQNEDYIKQFYNNY